MYLISPSKKQYKANLHSHSVISDGKRTPEELKKMYKSQGYSVLAITDHETPRNHSYLNDDAFIAITGYETYIRPDSECRYDAYGKERHIMTWNTGEAKENTNIKGHTVCFKLPEDISGEFKIILKSDAGDSTYRFVLSKQQKNEYSKSLNL